ncbi:MAG: rod shape-determining protein MreD [Rhodospirillales bacterium]|jgi:rod shape-determining protein MreD|nr:rod shape-determining protein MreD [Rhodospirillales bacterium]
MSAGFWRRLDQWARNLTPVGLTLVLILLGVLPIHVPGYSQVAPVMAIMSVYHWAIYRPQLLPVLAVFLLGLMQDLLSGAPAGLNALVMLTVYGTVAWQRRFLVGKSFFIYWFGFALIGLGASVESWLIASVWNLSFMGLRILFFQYVLALGFFPVIAWILLHWQRAFLQQE